MKTLLLVTFLFFSTVSLVAQTQGGKDPKIPVIERKSDPVAGNTPSSATPAGPRQRGVSISSAARRSSLQNPPAQGANGHVETTGNAKQGKSIANQMRQNRIERPNAGNRPNLRVPAARPSVPVVRPNRPLPNRPIRPIRRPGARI
jgi:hypothetical protein